MIAALLVLAAAPVEQSAPGIMAKVAENQQRAVEMRRAFVYRQNVLVRLKRGNGKLAREELRDLTVTPTPAGLTAKLERCAGKYEKNGRYIEYSKPGYRYKETDIDGELAGDLADDLVNEKGTRDGIACDLFPLTAERQMEYTFRLEGRQDYNGRDVYRVTFEPRDRDDGSVWAGEVLVDAREYQPVLITTHMSHGIPMAVRVLLGTNLRYLGFKVAYDKFAEGVWFPVRYGGEFELRAVFFYKRKIAISAINSGFQKADVESRVTSYTAP